MDLTVTHRIEQLPNGNARLIAEVAADGHPCGTLVIASGPREPIVEYRDGRLTWEQLSAELMGGI